MMFRNPARFIGLIILLGVACFMGWKWFVTPKLPSALLPTGQTVTMLENKTGITNTFQVSDPLQRWLGQGIPKQGWKWGKFQLRKPTGDRVFNAANFAWGSDKRKTNILSVAFQSSAPIELPPPQGQGIHKYRWLIEGDSGESFAVDHSNFWWEQHGILLGAGVWRSYLNTQVYPRSSKQLEIKLQALVAGGQAKPSETWSTHAQFSLPNPQVSEIASWIPDTEPIAFGPEAMQLELGGLNVLGSKPNNRIGQKHVQLLYQVKKGSIPQSNWRLTDLWAEDATGNVRQWHISKDKSELNGWWLSEFNGPLNVHQVWRMHANVHQESDWATECWHTVRKKVKANHRLKGKIRGMEVTVSLFEKSILQLRLKDPSKKFRIALRQVKDAAGRDVPFNYFRSERDINIGMLNKAIKDSFVDVSFVVFPQYPITFKIKPNVDQIDKNDHL